MNQQKSKNIRKAIATDVKPIAAMVRGLSDYYLADPTDELPNWLAETLSDEAFHERFLSKEYPNFVYEENDQIIGYIAIKQPNHLYHLFVAKPFHGQGIAKCLWSYVLSHGDYQSMTLRSSIYAIPVYERLGFIQSGTAGEKDGVLFQPMTQIFDDE